MVGNIAIAGAPLGPFGSGGAFDLDAYLLAAISPLLYYKFDEASGNLINYGSETGADGTVSGATQGQTGPTYAPGAYSFDGVNDVITVGIATLPTVKALSTQRWAFLLYATSLGEGNTGVFFRWADTSTYFRFRDTNRIDAAIGTSSTNAYGISNNNAVDFLNAWAWVFMDYDDADALGNGRIVRLWKGVNGTLTALTLATTTPGTGTTVTQSVDLKLGNRTSADATFAGLMALALCDSGLWTESELTAIVTLVAP